MLEDLDLIVETTFTIICMYVCMYVCMYIYRALDRAAQERVCIARSPSAQGTKPFRPHLPGTGGREPVGLQRGSEYERPEQLESTRRSDPCYC